MAGVFSKLKKIRGIKFIRQTYLNRNIQKKNLLWSKQDYILKNIKQSDSILEKVYKSNLSVIEVEHQIGRYLNMKKIAQKIISQRNRGVIVEFGTWQGLGLLLLDHAFQKISEEYNQDRISGVHFIGIDTFTGLPESSTVWLKGQFSDTLVSNVRNNLRKNLSKGVSFELIVGKFNEEHVKDKLLQHTNVAVFHFDADLGSSTTDALILTENYLINRSSSVYYIFDDWGIHPDEVPDAFNNWCLQAELKYSIKADKISSTRYTRTYEINFL